MKKILILFIILTTSVTFFASCDKMQPAELSDRLIAEAIGIDIEDGGYVVTVQALNTGAGGSGEGTSANEKTKIYNFYGITPGTALGSAETVDGLVPMFSHARLLVIGAHTTQSDTLKLLDYFMREYNVRSDVPVAAAKDRAADVISAEISDGVTDAAALEKAMVSGSETGKNVLMPLYRFVNLLLTPGDTAYCPVIGLDNDPYSDKKVPFLGETAFFRDELPPLIADAETTRALLLLRGDADGMQLNADTDNGTMTLKTVKCATKIKPSETDGIMRFEITTKLVCELTEYTGEGFSSVSSRKIAEAEKRLANGIREKEARALSGLFVENGCDICRFGRMTLLKHPGYYDKYILSPAELTQTEIKVNVKIRRSGRENLKGN